MARAFTSSTPRVISRPTQRVLINGTQRAEVVCLEIRQIEGLKPSEALIDLPFDQVGNSFDHLRDAEVIVYVGNELQPRFRGYLTTVKEQEDRNRSRVTLKARSVLGLLYGVSVGEDDESGLLDFPLTDPATGVATNYTLTSALSEAFSQLPSSWASKVQLGSFTGVANSTDYLIPKLEFNGSTLRQFLRQMFSLFPAVSMRERYTNDTTFLDWYLVGSVTNADRFFYSCTSSRGPEEGAWIQALSGDVSAGGVYNRAIGYGRFSEHMVTTSTNHSTAKILPAWGNPASDLDNEATYSASENAVLANPELANRKSPQYSPTLGSIFRVWRLPLVLRENVILGRNALRDADGRQYKIQIFRQKPTFSAFASYPWTTTGVSLSEFEELKGTILPDGYIELEKPCLAVREYGENGSRDFAFYPLYVTLTASMKRAGKRIRHDTGIRGELAFPNINPAFTFTNDSLARVTAAADSLTDSEGDSHDFDAIYFDVDTGNWTTVASETVITDDSELLATLTEASLTQRNKRRRTVSVTVPVNSKVRMGENFRVIGRGFDSVRFHAIAVSERLDSPATTIVGSDQRPISVDPARMKKPKTRGGGRQIGAPITSAFGSPSLSDYEQGPGLGMAPQQAAPSGFGPSNFDFAQPSAAAPSPAPQVSADDAIQSPAPKPDYYTDESGADLSPLFENPGSQITPTRRPRDEQLG